MLKGLSMSLSSKRRGYVFSGWLWHSQEALASSSGELDSSTNILRIVCDDNHNQRVATDTLHQER